MGRAVVQLVEALRYRTGGPAFDLRLGPWKFQVTYSFCPHLVALGSTQPLTEMSIKGFHWGESGAVAWS
jgi:hypothetical protein